MKTIREAVLTATMREVEMTEITDTPINLEVNSWPMHQSFILGLKDSNNEDTNLPSLELNLAQAQALYAELEEFLSQVG
jgi:hypothetical protein